MNRFFRFLRSLKAFLQLSRAGFYISHSGEKKYGIEIYRFWWGNRMIDDMADISCISGYYNTRLNGKGRSLQKD